MSAPRSLLIMPANRADMLTKAPSYGSDALIFDIEVSVPVAEKRKARKLGYRGKSLIHPNQIEMVNRIFMPTVQEVGYYRRVIEAFDAAVARGSAATTVDGKLVDYAMVGMAKRVIAWAQSARK